MLYTILLWLIGPSTTSDCHSWDWIPFSHWLSAAVKHLHLASSLHKNNINSRNKHWFRGAISPSGGVYWSWHTSWWACPQTWPGEVRRCTGGKLQQKTAVSLFTPKIETTWRSCQMGWILRYEVVIFSATVQKMISVGVWVCLTIHLSLEELDEGLCEGLNPFVHDVVTLLRCVFIVLELNVILLTHKYTNTHKSTQTQH